jgi:hypothetical protein
VLAFDVRQPLLTIQLQDLYEIQPEEPQQQAATPPDDRQAERDRQDPPSPVTVAQASGVSFIVPEGSPNVPSTPRYYLRENRARPGAHTGHFSTTGKRTSHTSTTPRNTTKKRTPKTPRSSTFGLGVDREPAQYGVGRAVEEGTIPADDAVAEAEPTASPRRALQGHFDDDAVLTQPALDIDNATTSEPGVLPQPAETDHAETGIVPDVCGGLFIAINEEQEEEAMSPTVRTEGEADVTETQTGIPNEAATTVLAQPTLDIDNTTTAEEPAVLPQPAETNHLETGIVPAVCGGLFIAIDEEQEEEAMPPTAPASTVPIQNEADVAATQTGVPTEASETRVTPDQEHAGDSEEAVPGRRCGFWLRSRRHHGRRR